jgi:trimeric autotransporter adhesin
MQRVFRFSLIGILGIASLTACGDKVQVAGVNNSADSTVTGVTVTPTSATMAVGDKLTFFASVSTGSAIKDHTVTWSSSNTAVATVDATGIVTAKAAGTTSIIATANADKTQGASATVTVGAGVQPSVSVSSINQTLCGFGSCSSVPANLANVVGQLDVILNVDPGTSKLNEVDLIMNCTGPGNTGTDTIVAKQTLSSADLAPAAEEATAPITLSFNTATFNTTSGVPSFKNGNCTIKAQAITQSGTGTAVTTKSTDLLAVVNNPDVVIGTLVAGKTALNPVTGIAWNGQTVTVSATPVFFTPNRTAVSQTITYEGKSATLNGAGTQSVTFKDDNDPTILAANSDPLNIDQITDSLSHNTLNVSVVDNNGQNFTNAAGTPIATAASFFANPGAPLPPWITQNGTVNKFRLDTKKPVSGTLVLAGNVQQNVGNFFINTAAYLNGSFKFLADSASGYQGADFLSGVAACPAGTVAARASNCDAGGVDSVTVVFQTATSSTGTYTTVKDPSSLPETNTNTANFLRQITTDRLGNADTTFSCGIANYTVGVGCVQYSAVAAGAASAPTSSRFGVDKTAPTLALTSGEADKNIYQATTAGNYFLSALDVGTVGGAGIGTYGGPGSLLVAQTRLWNDLNPSTFDPSVFEGQVFSTNPNAALSGGVYSGAAASLTTPCVIGRFNASSTKAGPNALTVFLRDGSTGGFCTPVAYNPTAGPSNTSGVPAASVVAMGYYKTQVIATDLANNVATTTFSAQVLEDDSQPTILSIDIPGTLAGNSTVSFPTSASDAAAGKVGDIVGSWAAISYVTPGITLQYPVTTGGAGVAFDNVLTRTATVTPTAPNFIKNLQVSAGGTTAPTSVPSTLVPGTGGTAGTPTTLRVSAIDAANNVSANAAIDFNTQPSQLTGSGTNFTAAGSGATFFTGGFSIAASTANVSNCPAAAGCGAAGSGTAAANPTTTTITATAAGTSGAFNNPFAAGTVQLWYRPQTAPAGLWFLAPAADVSIGTVSFADNGTQRQWIFNLAWNPPAATPVSGAGAPINMAPANAATILVDVMVVGVNGNGDAVATPPFTVTLTNP